MLKNPKECSFRVCPRFNRSSSFDPGNEKSSNQPCPWSITIVSFTPLSSFSNKTKYPSFHLETLCWSWQKQFAKFLEQQTLLRISNQLNRNPYFMQFTQLPFFYYLTLSRWFLKRAPLTYTARSATRITPTTSRYDPFYQAYWVPTTPRAHRSASLFRFYCWISG